MTKSESRQEGASKGRRSRSRVARNSRYSSFFRHQVRWALSCHRQFRQIGYPSLYLEIEDAFPKGYLEGVLNQQDIVNFLNGTESHDHKIEVFVKYLELKEPEYSKLFTKEDLSRQFGDVLRRVSFNPTINDKHHEKSLEFSTFLDGKAFFSIEKRDSTYSIDIDSELIVLPINFIAFRRIGGTPHLQVVRFNITLTIDVDDPKIIKKLEKFPSFGEEFLRDLVNEIKFSSQPIEDLYVGLSVLYSKHMSGDELEKESAEWFVFSQNLMFPNSPLFISLLHDNTRNIYNFINVSHHYMRSELSSFSEPYKEFSEIKNYALKKVIARISWSV